MVQSQQPDRWARLWAAVEPHDVEPGELGEYAAVLLERGLAQAEQTFPAVAAHLRASCDRCSADLAEIEQVLRQAEPPVRAVPPIQPLLVGPPLPPRRAAAGWSYGLGVALAAAVAVPSAVAASSPEPELLVRSLSLVGLLAGLAVALLLSNTWAVRSPVLAPAGQGGGVTPTRRGLLLGVVAAWLVGLTATYAVPTSPVEPILVVAEPALRPWVNEVIQRDPALRAMSWRIIAAEDAGKHPAEQQTWLGLDRAGAGQEPERVVVARSIYVVAAWEASLSSLGLDSPAPVDWATVQAAVERPDGPRFVLPSPSTPLGDDGLLLLALAAQGPNATTLRDQPAAEREAWLAPFYRRQSRLRSDERIQIDDWWRYRAGLGEAGLLPEHEALELIAQLPPNVRLHVRYPTVNVTRSYVLAARTSRAAGRAFDRLSGALLSSEAQRALWTSGFRPVASVEPPADGHFLTLRSRGADWQARWAEAVRDESFERWLRTWRP